MAVTVGGTSITFNDGTTQTTAAGGAPTTAQVLNATAGASVGAVGTYAILRTETTTGALQNPGATRAGSTLRYTEASGSVNAGTPAGTWRLMGGSYDLGVGYSQATSVWLRIS